MQAIEQHGALRGSGLMLARLARCHPYSAGGVDPVPQQFSLRCGCRANGTTRSPFTSALTSVETDHGH